MQRPRPRSLLQPCWMIASGTAANRRAKPRLNEDIVQAVRSAICRVAQRWSASAVAPENLAARGRTCFWTLYPIPSHDLNRHR